MSGLMALEDALELAIALAPHGAIERRPVEEALGLAIAADVAARRSQPAADLSAMDGYAIAGTGPWKRIGESRAGAPFKGKLAPGECTRISTGAHLPQGADAVLIQENAEIDGVTVGLAKGDRLPEAGAHVRQRGFDFEAGETVIARPGDRIGAGQLALLLAAGVSEVEVRAPARVAILECGDELCADLEALGPHQIPATNGAMIAALLGETGCTIARGPPVPDSADALAAALNAHADADILLVSGGASVGDHDLVQQALIDWGADLRAWKVAMKPGKPLMMAQRGDLAILGLPGNPVSSFVTAFLFALPMVRKAMGFVEVENPTLRGRMAQPLPPIIGPRREFLRARLEHGEVRLTGSQDSSALRALAGANCLIDRPAGSRAAVVGEEVTLYPLRNG